MIKAKEIHDIEKIKALLAYNPDTGFFVWRVNRKGSAKAGMKAGWRHGAGYVAIRVDANEYLAHRLAWVLHHGSLSVDDQIDHINGDRSDNRICNLRIASHFENCWNSKARSHSKSGIKGVRKCGAKWHVRIRHNHKTYWLGSYETPEEAKQAYDNAAIKYFGEFAENKRRPS
jgi:hypothetical protein